MSEIILFVSEEESFVLFESLPQSSGLTRSNYTAADSSRRASAQTNGSPHAKTPRPIVTAVETSAISFSVFSYSCPFHHSCHKEMDNKAVEHQARVSGNAASSREGTGLVPASGHRSRPSASQSRAAAQIQSQPTRTFIPMGSTP
ncbi:hypothetical protein DPX16_13547 [Anabarilius grahami]|uniref:Uncharacterized protein n=1 Tax=Anabarilius grahami TaxID=495550 RepID=A0A3N0YBI9_ANAGA|nr:hypothetical protein DPX16_13547 [Anabarilius grahami]